MSPLGASPLGARKLGAQTLGGLRPGVPSPGYDRDGLIAGIVHIGVGAFHRSHQAMVLDQLLEQGCARDFAICGLGLLERDRVLKEVLKSQDYLYTLLVKHPDGTREPRIIGSIVDFVLAPDDPAAAVERLADITTRIVSLTITEGGYNIDPTTGGFDAANPNVIEELTPGAPPTTMFAFVTAALRLRRDRGQTPFTVMSCDNIPGNGDLTRAMVMSFAQSADPDLAAWIGEHVAFPNSMVDRITPVTTKEDIEHVAELIGLQDAWPVVCEPFFQWVIEDHFTDGRPPLDAAGVQLVVDVAPYELMKLRLLNGSHQALAYFGWLSGFRYVHDAARDPAMAGLLRRYMATEAAPTLPPVPGMDLDAYQDQLIERFSNSEVRDTVARLCAESSDRIPKWLVPVIRDQLAHGGGVECSAAVVASWARYAEGVDENGETFAVVDQLSKELVETARRQHDDPLAFVRNRRLFGDLIEEPGFTEPYLRALHSLFEHGAHATVTALSAKPRPAFEPPHAAGTSRTV